MTYYRPAFLCPSCLGARQFRGVPCDTCNSTGRDPDQSPRPPAQPAPVRHRKREKPVRILNIARERESEL